MRLTQGARRRNNGSVVKGAGKTKGNGGQIRLLRTIYLFRNQRRLAVSSILPTYAPFRPQASPLATFGDQQANHAARPAWRGASGMAAQCRRRRSEPTRGTAPNFSWQVCDKNAKTCQVISSNHRQRIGELTQNDALDACVTGRRFCTRSNQLKSHDQLGIQPGVLIRRKRGVGIFEFVRCAQCFARRFSHCPSALNWRQGVTFGRESSSAKKHQLGTKLAKRTFSINARSRWRSRFFHIVND